MIVISIIILLILILIIFWQISTLISIFGGVQYVYSGNKIIYESLGIAKIKKSDIFYELGSGFGNGLIIASREFGVKSIGIEISPFHYLVSKLKTFTDKNIKIIFSDTRKVNLKNADIIFCYLFPKLLNNLSDKFLSELKLGTIIISNSFKIDKLKPYLIKEIACKQVYFYRI